MTSTISGDPLFQLNLVLFASFRFPSGARINPFLYNAGYQIYKISPDLSLPPSIFSNLSNIPCGIKQKVKPEVLLQHKESGKISLIECKRSSFSSSSSTAKQAASYLALCDDTLRDSLALPTNQSIESDLFYCVTCGQEKLLCVSLAEVREYIEKQGVPANPFGVCGIEQRDDGIYLTLKHSPQWDMLNVGEVKVIESEAGTDPRTLYLIPLDIGIDQPDEYTKMGITSRIKSSFMSQMMISLGRRKPLELIIDRILSRSLQIWEMWEDSDSKKYLRNAARTFIREQLHLMSQKYGIKYTDCNHSFLIEPVTPDQIAKIERYFLSREYSNDEVKAFPGQLNLEFD